MMRRLIIIKLVLFGWLPVLSQQLVNADSLMLYEYRHFISADTTEKNELLLMKFNLYLRNGVIDENALRESRRIDHKRIRTENDRRNFLWNAGIVAYSLQQRDYADFLLSEYLEASRDSSTTCLLLIYLVEKYHDTISANEQLHKLMMRDSVFSGLRCFNAVAAYEKKHLNLNLLSSFVVPGLGTMMNGYVFKGLTSLVINGAAIYGIVKMVESGLYLNAILWGTGVGLKFYAGNIRLTEKSFQWAEDRKKKQLADNCEENLDWILKKYPINVKN